MSYWQILKPQAGQNLIAHPSFERTPWAWVDHNQSFLTSRRSMAQMYRGRYGYYGTPNSSTDGGAYYPHIAGVNGNHTFSIYAWFAVGVPFLARITTTANVTVGAAVTATGTGAFQRIAVTASLTSGTAYRLWIQKNNSTSTAEFYLDAAQLELGSVATTYIDGDQPGCSWNAQEHESTSTRSAQSTAGGVWLDFEDDLGIIPLEMQGVGMPPLDNVATPYALLPGARFERSLARSRVFTIVCLVPGSTWANMHALREALIARVQPDQTTQQQPIYLRYTGASEPQIIAAHYDGGLEFAQPTGFAETVPLRFVAHDPFWYSDKDEAMLLTGNTVNNDYLVFTKNDGTWTSLDSALNGVVDAVVDANDGESVIVVGNFTNAGGVAAADYIAKYNLSTNTWSALGTGANGRVRCVVVEGNRIYVGGDFTTIGGSAFVRIAFWDGFTWNSMGDANSSVRALIYANGTVIATGAFTTIGGVAANRIAHYNTISTAWTAVGTGLNGQGNTLVLQSISTSTTFTYYVGGAFTTAAGVTVNRVARYNGTTFEAMGVTGVNNTVNALALTSNGQLYVGGAFTTAGGITANYIAQWTGAGWQAMPTGPASAVTSLSLDTNGRLYATAPASGFPALQTDTFGVIGAAVLNGNTWLPVKNAYLIATVIFAQRNGNIWFSHDTTGTIVRFGDPITVPYNGTAPVGVMADELTGIINITSQQAVYLSNFAQVFLRIDTRDGYATVINKTTKQNRSYLLIAGSDMTLRLLPGNNIVAGWAKDAVLYWRPRNWSLDV